MKDSDLVLEIRVRRLSSSPFFDLEFIEHSKNEKELLAVWVKLESAFKKAIDDEANKMTLDLGRIN